MIESINNSVQISNIQPSHSYKGGSVLLDFDIEDQAIISSQAKILNELEKFNAGEGNEVELALATVMGEVQVEASANVIKAKNEMMDAIMDMI